MMLVQTGDWNVLLCFLFPTLKSIGDANFWLLMETQYSHITLSVLGTFKTLTEDEWINKCLNVMHMSNQDPWRYLTQMTAIKMEKFLNKIKWFISPLTCVHTVYCPKCSFSKLKLKTHQNHTSYITYCKYSWTWISHSNQICKNK